MIILTWLNMLNMNLYKKDSTFADKEKNQLSSILFSKAKPVYIKKQQSI